MAATTALDHHEDWDGAGHSYGRRGKKAWEPARIHDYIKQKRGCMFDPSLEDDPFLNLDYFLHIAETIKDQRSA